LKLFNNAHHFKKKVFKKQTFEILVIFIQRIFNHVIRFPIISKTLEMTRRDAIKPLTGMKIALKNVLT